MKNKPSLKPLFIVRDYFYQDPDSIRDLAKTMKYSHRSTLTGYMTNVAFHEKGIRQRVARMLGAKITRWDISPGGYNGIFYGGFSAGPFKERPSVHSDVPYDDLTILVYLTPDLPSNCGTSFWEHKATGLTSAPTAKDAHDLGINISKLRRRLERDAGNKNCWIEIDRIGYRYNRMVAFASGMLHSATRHFGSDLESGRVFQAFRIGIDWSSFQLAK